MRGIIPFACLLIPLFAFADFICGDAFRSFADFVFDGNPEDFQLKEMEQGSIVFVKTDDLETFYTHVHKRIIKPYVLITHNSHLSAPGPFIPLLNSPKLMAWFACNVTLSHKKLIPIPCGISNPSDPHGDPSTFESIEKNGPKSIPLYMNFSSWKCPEEREPLYALFASQSFCYAPGGRSLSDYLTDITQSEFVLCPRGQGLDGTRRWETLAMGSFPILKHSSLDPLFEDLPVLIVDDWSEITQASLRHHFKIMSESPYNLEKLTCKYWRNVLEHVLEVESKLDR